MSVVREAALPVWLQSFARQLQANRTHTAVHILVPLVGLDELLETARSVISGRGQISKADRVSLKQDLALALDEIGPRLTEVIKPDLRAFQSNDLSALPSLLADVEGARRLAVAAEVLAARFTMDPAVVAAWADARAAFEAADVSEVCELRIAQLRSLVERRGHAWEERAGLLTSLIHDDLFSAIRVGAVEEPPAEDQVDPNARAGLSQERRLELCERVLVEGAREAEVKVWFAFANARLDHGYLRKGPVQFFNSQLWPEGIRDPPLVGADGFVRPDELDDQFAELHISDLPERDGILAQVSLPNGPIAGAQDRARHLLRGLVEAAAGTSSGWKLLDGSSAYSEATGWWGALGFTDPDEWARAVSSVDPEFDPTALELERLSDTFVAALTERDTRAEAALEELRWELAAREADAAQQLALRIRTLEGALPTPAEVQGRLPEFARRHLRDAWSFFRFRDELAALARATGAKRFVTENQARSRLDALYREMGETHSAPPRITLSLAAIVEHADEAAGLLPEDSMEGRITREVARAVSTGPRALAEMERFDRRFDRLIARSVRQRNSIIHGSNTVAAVIESCQPFVVQLIGFLVHHAIDAAGSGIDRLTRLEEVRSRRLNERARLAVGDRVAEVLVDE